MLRNSKSARIGVAALLVVALISSVANAAPQVVPLAHAHAHNDYAHAHPLLDALDLGFTSVEADVYLVDGKILVGHDHDKLKPERTLESLYLAPLADRVRQNGGRVFAQSDRFFLLIDIKDDPKPTYGELQKLFAKYATMLTSIESEKVRPGAITVVLTGNRPMIDETDPRVRYAGIDGRLMDLDGRLPAHLMPMISDNWTKAFKWNGIGEMPASEKAKLKTIVKKSHAAGRVLRFWATPENESVWRELRSAGVDLIGTDQLDRLSTFLHPPDDKH